MPHLLENDSRMYYPFEMCLRPSKGTMSNSDEYSDFAVILGFLQKLPFYSKTAHMRDTFLHSSILGRTCAFKWGATKSVSRGSICFYWAKRLVIN